MLSNRINNLGSRLIGLFSLESLRACKGHGKSADASASAPAAGVIPEPAWIRRYLWTALFLVLLAPGQGITATNGDKIVNNATFHAFGLADVATSATVTVVARTQSTIEFLKYAPGISGATALPVRSTYYQSSPAGVFTLVPGPYPFGSTTPVDLTFPVPLLSTAIFHAGEPVFIRVTDLDQNIDKAAAETITITVTDPITGDSEILKLTETGTDTGIFIGYIQSVPATSGSGNGTISVVTSSSITARYTDPVDGSDSSIDAALVDPFGLVFDTVSGQPIDGATVQLIDAATGLGAVVLGDNGVSTNIYPNTVITGGTATDTDGNIYTFPPGGYRFPYVAPGNYLLRITPPVTYTAPSTASNAQIQTLPGAPFVIIEPGSRGGVFTLPVGPAFRVDIPLDPKTGTIWLSKRAGKSIVSVGDFISYDISLENNDPVGTLFSTVITDKLPPGFRYQQGSIRINDIAAADPVISADGSTMTFAVGTVAPKSSLTIRYVVAVGAGAIPGTATNTATAATTPAVAVNTATAEVQVQEPFMISRNIIMGRVVVGACSENIEDNKKGMEGIGIYLEDGTFVFSDKFGMFHFEGVRPGSHVVQLDLDSIPEGYKILPCEQNSRFAGRAYSQFVDLQGGTMWRTDFYLGKTELSSPAPASGVEKSSLPGRSAEGSPQQQTAEANAEPAAAAANNGEISFEMLSSQNDDTIDYRIPLQAHTVSLKNLRLRVSLPDGARYIYGSSSYNGTALPDPEVTSAGLVYPLEDTTDRWRGELQFRAVIDKKRQAGELLTRAVLNFDTAVATNNTTPEVTNILSLTKDQQLVPLPQFVFRPHFPTFGSELSAVDLEELDSLAKRLADKVIKRIDVTGHTDNVRIAPRSRDIHADNTALSLARAKSVGRFLTSALHLPPDALYLNGSADKDPVATNSTAAGRALNRRVEVKITALQRVETSILKLIKERSGVEKQETVGIPLKQKGEIPLPPQPLQLNQEKPAPLSTADKSAAAKIPENGAALPPLLTSEPLRKTEPLPSKPAVSNSNEERAELVSVINEGIVQYRLKLKGVKQPPGKVTVSLTLPKSLLYMNGTSRLMNAAVADPQVNESALRYDFAKIDDRKKFDLRLQALFDGDGKSEDTASRVTVEIADEAGNVLKTFSAACNLSDDMEELNRTDAEPEAVLKGEGAQQVREQDDSALYQENLGKPSGETKAASAAQNSDLHVLEDEGILSHADGSVIATRINAVRVVLASELTPALLLDGKEIPVDRIGFSMKDKKSGKSLYTYIGVDFGEAGEHTLQLKGVDTFGLARFDRSVDITRTGEIAYIRLVSADGNVADGKTPVKVRVQLFDTYNKPVAAHAELAIKGGDLRPLASGGNFGREAAGGMAAVSGEGWIDFQPVTSSGLYRVQLAYNKATLDVETYVKPKMRDWILVGIAEGTAGYNTLSGHMENVKFSGTDDHLYDKERLAFYAKGTIKGEWLLTMAYDSDKQRTGVAGNALFQIIDPNSFYTLYGDATTQGYEAASQKKLYLKVERDQFYAMFGDYNTGLTVTELSRYSRSMTGIKSEFRSKNFEVTAFGAETAQAFVKDELRGDGTSGLYRLSRKGIVINSDKITIETRDRFHSEIIIDSRQLSRFVDYNIDYDTGAIFFKSPVPSRDELFNPVYIVVDYEITNAGNDALTYGGRAGTTLLNGKVKAGATYVHEGQVSGESNLYGVDAGMQLGAGTRARAEFATTTTDLGTTKTNGNAWLAEITHTDKNFDGRAYYYEQESGFGLGQQNNSESGTRKFGVDGSYKLNQQLSVGGQAYRQENLATGAVRDFIESVAIYTDKQFSGRAGLRYANDSLEDGSNNTSIQATAGGSWKTLNQRLTLRADHEQSLFNNNNNTDFPTRSIFGIDYQVTKETLLFAQEELTYGAAANTSTTRIGVKATPWSGGTVASSVVNDMRENDERTFANVGLVQKWQVTPQWAVDGGLDHNQTIRKKTGYSLYNPAYVPPASGGESFTAVSLGANYTERKLVWSNRVEYRNSDVDDKWGIISTIINEQGLNWGWTARLQLGHIQSPGGNSTTAGDLRFGLAYRPPVTRWIVLDRMDLIAVDEKTATSSSQGQRMVNNLNVNYKPDKKTQISIQYGSKYVMEKIDDSDCSGYTDLIGLEGRYDLTREWDLGLRGSMLHTWENSQFGYSFGPSVGYNVMENAWISLGYNVVGFHDKDFSAANYTAQGPFVQFRFKFDQNSIRDGLKALNQL